MCGRRFSKQNQSHSCRVHPRALHFAGKEQEKHLYQYLEHAIRNRVGSFIVESLPCCIHFVSGTTFAAVRVFRKKIQVTFGLSRKLSSKRIDSFVHMSAHRYLYAVSLQRADEIDSKLLDWIHEAYDLHATRKAG